MQWFSFHITITSANSVTLGSLLYTLLKKMLKQEVGSLQLTLVLSICFFIMLYVVYQAGEGHLLTVNSTEFSLGSWFWVYNKTW